MMLNRLRHAIALALIALLAACGGGSDNASVETPSAPPATPAPPSPPANPPAPVPPAVIARIEIAPGAILLSEVGQTKQLVARAYAADGAEVAATGVTWTSSRESAIAIDAQGVARAIVANGSAQIRARVGDVTSEAILAVATALPAGTVTVSDAQVFGDPVATNPNAEPSLTNTYRVVLQDMAPPAVGALLVASESKPVAGRVVSVVTEGGRHTVTLKIEPVRQMFPQLSIRESFDLSNAPMIVNPEIAVFYDVQRVGNEWQFTPKSSDPIRATNSEVVRRQSGPAPIKGTFPLGPLTCEATVVGATFPLAIVLNAAPAISFTPTLGLDIVHTEANGLEEFVVRGELVGKIDASLTMSQAIDGKFSCWAEVGAIPAPITGALAVIITPMIPIEAGVEAGGRLTLASATLGAKAELKGSGQVGVKCPSGGCNFVNTFTGSATATPTLKAPSLNDQRFEPSLQLYLKAKGAIGNKFLKALRISAFEASVGPKLSGTFASERAQIGDTSYKSEYKLSVETKVGAGPKLGDFLQFFGLSETFSIVEAVATIDVGRSPTATVSADRDVFAAGETVNLKVAFDRPTLDFLPAQRFYNVSRVVVMRRAPSAALEEVKSVDVAKDTSELIIPVTPTTAGEASELSAFVITVVPSFPLELGAPAAPKPPPPPPPPILRSTVGATVVSNAATANVTSSARFSVSLQVDGGGRLTLANSPSAVAYSSTNVQTSTFLAPSCVVTERRERTESLIGALPQRSTLEFVVTEAGDTISVAWRGFVAVELSVITVVQQTCNGQTTVTRSTSIVRDSIGIPEGQRLGQGAEFNFSEVTTEPTVGGSIVTTVTGSIRR